MTATSTVAKNGQTTVPQEIRKALELKPGQRLLWSLQEDGSAIVRPQGNALDLFGSLKSRKKYPGRAAEREGVTRAVGRHAAKEGTE